MSQQRKKEKTVKKATRKFEFSRYTCYSIGDKIWQRN